MNVIRPLIVALLGGAMSYLAASILWIFPGSTVTNGPSFASVSCLLTLTLGFILIIRLGRKAPNPSAYRWYTIGLELTLLTIAIVAWKTLSSYYIGWLASFGAIVLTVASLWQLISDVLETAPPKPNTRAETAYRQKKIKLGTASATATVVAIVAIVVLTPIHELHLEIISPVTVIVSAALLLALMVTRIITTATSPQNSRSSGESLDEKPRSEMAHIPNGTG